MYGTPKSKEKFHLVAMHSIIIEISKLNNSWKKVETFWFVYGQ